MLVVLDELETVAEAATFGLEDEQDKRLDGQAIRPQLVKQLKRKTLVVNFHGCAMWRCVHHCLAAIAWGKFNRSPAALS